MPGDADHLMTIARTARLVARNVPGAGAVFQLPQQRADIALLTAARAFIREGHAAMDRFVPLGIAETFIKDLQGLVNSFEQADCNRRAGRAGAAAAQAGIARAIGQGMDAVRSELDVVVINTFAGNPVLLTTWKRARHTSTKVKRPARVKPSVASTEPAAAPASGTPPVSPGTATTRAIGAAPLTFVPNPLKRAS